MNITDIRIYEVNKDNLKALASITIDRDFVVTGISVREGKNGLFVSMPSKKVGEKWSDICYPITKEARQTINNAVLEKYNGDNWYAPDEGFYPE